MSNMWCDRMNITPGLIKRLLRRSCSHRYVEGDRSLYPRTVRQAQPDHPADVAACDGEAFKEVHLVTEHASESDRVAVCQPDQLVLRKTGSSGSSMRTGEQGGPVEDFADDDLLWSSTLQPAVASTNSGYHANARLRLLELRGR